MNITVVGTGYVGLVTGACLAEMGNHVVCLDRDPGRIATLLRGELPIHEPGLLDIVLHNTRCGRLAWTLATLSGVLALGCGWMGRRRG